MRPAELAPLFASVADLPGVGPKSADALTVLCGPRVLDLLWHRPLRFVDRRLRESLQGLQGGETVTLKLRLGAIQTPDRKGLPTRIPAMHRDGGVTLVFFNTKGPWLSQQFPSGEERLVSGKIERYRDGWQMVHPDLSLPLAKADALPTFEPVYPTRAGLAQHALRKAIEGALGRVPTLPEWQNETLKSQRGWPPFAEALGSLHSPQTSRARLAYDEILAGQVALAVLRRHRKRAKAPALPPSRRLVPQMLAALPFDMTGDQSQATALISAQIARAAQASTLLQGDVGTGKTLVAFAAMLQAVEAKHQAVLMAPTEILARQHAATLKALRGDLPVSIACLTGQDKGTARREILALIESGDSALIVGTHALFQEGIRFQRLGLAVIDEQHRFGVQQRLALSQKGQAPHLLLMSATPIPRTLVMTAYGDLELCEIREKPPGRLPIKTSVKPLNALDEVLRGVERILHRGAQVYWVCPLVEASEALPGVGDVTSRFEALRKAFGDQVGLIHGQMPSAEKEAAMANFKAGKTCLLVATTVIEVGVDVPSANTMIIENAERFGLAQMHQIRGRVGRGEEQGMCLLLYANPLSAMGKQRLAAMRASTDGFDLSEQDLKLRGGGEVLGTRQSGLPEMRIADYATDQTLMQTARRDAQLLLDKDPTLTSKRGQAIRTLLYLFSQDQVAPFLKVG